MKEAAHRVRGEYDPDRTAPKNREGPVTRPCREPYERPPAPPGTEDVDTVLAETDGLTRRRDLRMEGSRIARHENLDERESDRALRIPQRRTVSTTA